MSPPEGASFGRARAPGSTPWLLVAPLLVLALTLLYWDPLRRSGDVSVDALGDGRPTSVAGFRGRVDAGSSSGSGWDEVRLAPLHPRPERQAFEAEVLERRLGLGPGEPWRLELRRASEAPAASLRAAVVTDARGEALRAVELGGASSAGPLGLLFDASALRVESGERCGVVLWGRRPGDGARLEGIPGRDGAAPSSVPLEPSDLAGEALPRHLARLVGGAGAAPGDTADGTTDGTTDGAAGGAADDHAPHD